MMLFQENNLSLKLKAAVSELYFIHFSILNKINYIPRTLKKLTVLLGELFKKKVIENNS